MTAGWKLPSFESSVPTAGDSEGSDANWDPQEPVDVGLENLEEKQAAEELGAGDVFFSDDDLAAWTGKQAIEWITDAGNSFEVLGIRPRPLLAKALLRRRYFRLSLLTHPDKNPEPEAAAAFKKLSDSMRILTNGSDQEKLLLYLFPKSTHVQGGSRAAASKQAEGFYDTPRSRLEREAAAVKSELETEFEQNRREDRELHEADQEAAERSKKRNSLSELLQGKKLRSSAAGESVTPNVSSKASAVLKKRLKPKPKRASAAATPAQASNSWGVPQEFLPPTTSAGCGPQSSAQTSAGAKVQPTGDASALADPITLWRLTGVAGLSAGVPGAVAQELPPGWQRQASRSKPGSFYFVNRATGETQTNQPGASTIAASSVPIHADLPDADPGPGANSAVSSAPPLRQAWPWEKVSDDGQRPAPAHPDLPSAVDEFLQSNTVDASAEQVFRAAPAFVQRQILHGRQVFMCGDPSASLIAHVDYLMSED